MEDVRLVATRRWVLVGRLGVGVQLQHVCQVWVVWGRGFEAMHGGVLSVGLRCGRGQRSKDRAEPLVNADTETHLTPPYPLALPRKTREA